MDDVLLSSEIEFYVETMTPQKIQNLGTKLWLEWHQRLQKLNQQALVEAAMLKEEHVKETLVNFGKVPVLIHEAILINIWKHQVLPQLLKLEPNPKSTFIAYSILYHEAVAVALLELVMYHSSCCEIMDDTAADLLDYASRVVTPLVNMKQKNTTKSESGAQEILRQRHNLSFEIGIRSLAIIRYIAENLDRLPLNVASRMFKTYDIPVLFVEILLARPWIKDGKMYTGGKWMAWDGEVVGQYEAQVWLTIRQLLLDPACSQHYTITESTRTQLMKIMQLLSPTVLDQISPLIELKHWLCRLSAMEQVSPPSKSLLLETILEIRENIIKQCGGKWKKIANQQLPIIFCDDQKTLMETAQTLNEAFNTDLLEKFDVNEKATCNQCGKIALQRCSRCKKTWYCSRSCQVSHWPEHKEECGVNGE